MFIVIMVLILGTCISVLSSIYYNTISLQKTYGTANAYYGAYYGAMSSIERGLLMTKLKYPTYVGSGGFRGGTGIGALSNTFSGDFRRLSHSDNTMIWTVNSITTNIKGNVDTKTLRTISFIKYNDPEISEYKNEGVSPIVYGVGSGLVFSGTANPSQNGRNAKDLNVNVDFNRFFSMINPNTTVRGLLKGQWKDSQGFEEVERSIPLTGSFTFGDNTVNDGVNPRPTLSGRNADRGN